MYKSPNELNQVIILTHKKNKKMKNDFFGVQIENILDDITNNLENMKTIQSFRKSISNVYSYFKDQDIDIRGFEVFNEDLYKFVSELTPKLAIDVAGVVILDVRLFSIYGFDKNNENKTGIKEDIRLHEIQHYIIHRGFHSGILICFGSGNCGLFCPLDPKCNNETDKKLKIKSVKNSHSKLLETLAVQVALHVDNKKMLEYELCEVVMMQSLKNLMYNLKLMN